VKFFKYNFTCIAYISVDGHNFATNSALSAAAIDVQIFQVFDAQILQPYLQAVAEKLWITSFLSRCGMMSSSARGPMLEWRLSKVLAADSLTSGRGSQTARWTVEIRLSANTCTYETTTTTSYYNNKVLQQQDTTTTRYYKYNILLLLLLLLLLLQRTHACRKNSTHSSLTCPSWRPPQLSA